MQILFKFWLGHTKKMTYEHTLSEIHKVIPEFTDDIIPLQYTGLSDLNGKGIFNGDLLKTDSCAIMAVEYREDMAMFVCRFDEGASTNIDSRAWEVIGNIYENPELLNPSVK